MIQTLHGTVEVFGKFETKREILLIYLSYLNDREWPCGTEPVKYPPEPVEIPPDRGFTILGLLIGFFVIISCFRSLFSFATSNLSTKYLRQESRHHHWCHVFCFSSHSHWSRTML